MPISFVKGDLIELALDGVFDVIVHGCNCFCTMGAGIALGVARNFPEAAIADRKTVYGDASKLGNFTIGRSFARELKPLIVVNAYTQFQFRGQGQKADYEAIRKAMRGISRCYSGKKIGMPRIGSGLARGDWPTIFQIIKEEMEGVDVTIVSLPNRSVLVNQGAKK